MKIAIIGTGNVGGALATQWSNAGHEINLGVRNTEDFKGEELLNNGNTNAYSIHKAVQLSEVILVATPPQIAPELAKTFGDIAGKVLIDATNSFRQRPDPYITAYHAFQELTSAALVKCFNSTGFENMKNPKFGDKKLDMFMAGDDDFAKATAKQLAWDAGFDDCYDFGGSDKVGLLENFALCWINLAIFQGHGRALGIKILKR